MKLLVLASFLFSPLLIEAKSPVASPESLPESKPAAHLANPASENCAKQGGFLLIKKRGDGGQYGVCVFENDRQCEEWALFRGECKKGGVSIDGLSKASQIYCAILGGKNSDIRDLCTFNDGSVCEDAELFNGKCQKGDHKGEAMKKNFP